MSKKKLYKDSPLNALGQGINDILNYQDLKQASGQFDPVGESLFSLGEMFASKSWDGIGEQKKLEKEIAAIEKEDVQSKLFNEYGGSGSSADQVDWIGDEEADEAELDDIINAGKIVPVAEPIPVTETVVQNTVVDVAQDTGASNLKIGKNILGLGGTGVQDTVVTGGQSQEEIDRINSLKKLFNQGKFTSNQRSMYERYKATGEIDSSAFKRMNPEKLKALKGLMYNTSNGDSPLRRISHMMNSPFLKTDEGPNLEKVDFRYMKRATSTGIGSLGGAASAGYNLAIDAKNYETAVQKDYDDEVSEGMGDLVKELEKTNPNYESDMFELASAKKKEYADGFAAYAAGDIDRLTWENLKMKLKGDLENHGKALNVIAQTDKSFAEGKGFAFNTIASDSQIVDYYNARMKNPDAFTVKNIDGVDTYVGKTLQGKEVKIPISMIANGAAKLQLVPKYDVNKAVNQGLKVMKAFTVEGKTALGTGSRNLDPNNPEEAAQLREMAVDAIKREIGADETRLRSILADERKLGFNEVEQLLNAEDGSRNENLQGLLQQMSEEIYDEKILNQGGYQAESRTQFRAQQPKEVRGSEKERAAAIITSKLNNLGPISPDNISQYASLLPSDMTIETDRDGRMFIAKGNKQLDYITADNAKALIAKATGVKGYGLGNNKSNQVTIDSSQSRNKYNY